MSDGNSFDISQDGQIIKTLPYLFRVFVPGMESGWAR